MPVLLRFLQFAAVMALAFLPLPNVEAFRPFTRPFVTGKISTTYYTKDEEVKAVTIPALSFQRISFGGKLFASSSNNDLADLENDEEDLEDADMEMEEYSEEEQRAYLKEEFEKLAQGKEVVTMDQFLAWEEIHQLIEEEFVTKEDIMDIWAKHSSSSESINLDNFYAVNADIDELLEDIEDDLDEGDEERSDKIPLSKLFESEELKNMADKIEPSVWFPALKTESLFEPNFYQYLSETYTTLAAGSSDNTISFESFTKWEDIARFLEDSNMDVEILHAVWKEAIDYQYRPEDLAGRSYLDMPIDKDTFYRLSYRLDDMMEQLQSTLQNMTDKDVEDFYRNEFQALTKGGKLLTYDALLQWPLLKDILESSPESFSIDNLQESWDALPKELNEFGEKAITEDHFLLLNEAIDDAVMSVEVPASQEMTDSNVLQ